MLIHMTDTFDSRDNHKLSPTAKTSYYAAIAHLIVFGDHLACPRPLDCLRLL